jgi:hypothetical protein
MINGVWGKERNLVEMLGFFRDMLVSADEVEVLNPTRQQWSAFSLNVQVLLILKLEDRLDSTYMAIPLNIFFSSYCSYTHVLKMWRCGECKNKDKEMEACKGNTSLLRRTATRLGQKEDVMRVA